MSVARAVALAFGVLVLITAASASAQNSRPSPPLGAPGASDLLAKAQDALRKRLQQQSTTIRLAIPAQERVVCGITVIPTDPTIDAAMRHPVPKPDGVKFAVRIVEPPCRP